MNKIAVLDSGGQYCHLIARKVRELGVYAEILPLDAAPRRLAAFRGFIISGGPSSVFTPDGPQPYPKLFETEKPLLGISYGHHLLAQAMARRFSPVSGSSFIGGGATLRESVSSAIAPSKRATAASWPGASCSIRS
jgi:GMP synthase-like glutamine amidotransferase